VLYLDVFIYGFCIAVAIQMEGQMIEYEFGRSTSVLIFGFVGLFFEGLLS